MLASLLPYARAVGIEHAYGTEWVVQASFVERSDDDRDWTSIDAVAPRDGRDGPRSRKVHPAFMLTVEQARAKAEACMRNASEAHSVYVPLLRDARAILQTHSGQPPFEEVVALLARAKSALRAYESEVSLVPRDEAGLAYGEPRVAELLRGIHRVLFETHWKQPAFAFTGEMVGSLDLRDLAGGPLTASAIGLE